MKDQKRFAALALSAIMVVSMAGNVYAAKEIKSKDYNYYKIIEKIPDGTSKPLSEVLEGLVLVDFVPTSENLCKFFYKVASQSNFNAPKMTH